MIKLLKFIGVFLKFVGVITIIVVMSQYFIEFLFHKQAAIILSLALVFFSVFQPTLLKLSLALIFSLATIGLELYFATDGIVALVGGLDEVASFYLTNIVVYFLVFAIVGAITLISGCRPVIADRIMLLSVICIAIKVIDGLLAASGLSIPHYIDAGFYASFNVVYMTMVYFLIKRYPGDRIHIFHERRDSDSGYHWNMESSKGIREDAPRRSGDKGWR